VEGLKIDLANDELERVEAEKICDTMMEDLQRQAFEGKRESDLVAAAKLKCEVRFTRLSSRFFYFLVQQLFMLRFCH
jgi:hypothetical protein